MTQVIVTTPEQLESLIQNSVRKVFTSQTQQVQNPLLDRLLSINEAAAFLSLSRQTLYGFTSKELIPFIKKGKKLYFQQSELEKWLHEGKRAVTESKFLRKEA